MLVKCRPVYICCLYKNFSSIYILIEFRVNYVIILKTNHLDNFGLIEIKGKIKFV